MAQKYYIKYYDTVNVLHEIKIYNDDYSGDVIDVLGSCILTYVDTNNALEQIRGSSLRIELEANPSLDFKEFYEEPERTFNVKYYRATELKFNGWLNPKGWFENYNVNRWYVNFDCIDGLGLLKDLAFVDENNDEITDAIIIIDVISNALRRTGLELNINLSIDIEYTGLGVGDRMVENTYIYSDRFIQEDGETITSCYDMLTSVLSLFTASLTIKNGEWYIYRVNQLTDDSTIDFEVYDFEGTYISTDTNVDLSETIGSNIDDIAIHFVNNNQTISIDNAIGAYKINYKYKFKQNILFNSAFCTTDGISPDGWTVLWASIISFPNWVSGELCGDMTLIGNDVPSTTAVLAPQSGSTKGSKLSDSVVMTFKGFHQGYSLYINSIQTTFKVRVTLVCAVNTYYLTNDNLWDIDMASGSYHIFQIQTNLSVDFTFEIITPPQPEDGVISWTILDPTMEGSPYHNQYFNLQEASVVLNPDTEAEGEVHLFTRDSANAIEVIPIKEVINGDSESSYYNGTLYMHSAFFTPGDPTTTWYRVGVTEALPLLQIMGEETMKMTPKPARIFSGDVFGYLDYLSLISIDGLTGKWIIIGYSYDTLRNITSLRLREVFNDDLADLTYEYYLDNGNVIKPTIVD